MDKLDIASLALTPVDLNRDVNHCVDFLRDSFRCSFGGSVEWEKTFGANGNRYREWLQTYSGIMLHAWRGERIVGELMLLPRDGYLQHIYVVGSLRGQGVGRWLHQEFLRLLELHAKREAFVKVSRINQSAVGFYTHLGWRCVGEDEKDPKLDVYHLGVTINNL